MRKPRERDVARLLESRPGIEPPAELANKIKAEIPALIAITGGNQDLARMSGMGRRSAYRPLLLIAASLLVVVGFGFVAARLLRPPDDLAREIALSGVTVIDDIVVSVPPRPAVEPEAQAPRTPGGAPDIAAPPPDGESSAEAQAEAVTVVVRHHDGSPCQGARVRLERGDGVSSWLRVAETDRNGVAFFLGVPVGSYTLSAGFSAARPATLEMLQVTQRTVTRVDLRVSLPDRT